MAAQVLRKKRLWYHKSFRRRSYGTKSPPEEEVTVPQVLPKPSLRARRPRAEAGVRAAVRSRRSRARRSAAGDPEVLETGDVLFFSLKKRLVFFLVFSLFFSLRRKDGSELPEKADGAARSAAAGAMAPSAACAPQVGEGAERASA